MSVFSFFSSQKRLGILGGGQLGKMLLQCTRQWDIQTKVLDPDPEAPSRFTTNQFVCGSLMDYDIVYQFGKDCDVLTIEIEHVNTEALLKLEEEGVIVHPKPASLAIIQDKGLQKMFFASHQIPSSDFGLYDSKEDILKAIQGGLIQYPFVQKTRKAGYDGKGVSIIHNEIELNGLLEAPSIVEPKVKLKGEIAVVAARNAAGEIVTYDPVSMDFHEGANMLDLLLYPAPIPKHMADLARQMAHDLIDKFEICGLLAVEFLIDEHDKLLVNEVAPRPHNSGHQTIESSATSQYEQHLRAILNLPLGCTSCILPSAMVNLLGHPDCEGNVNYEGMEACLKQEGVHVHIYGKQKTKPYRKMGHATITHASLNEAKKIAIWVKQTLQVKSL